MRRKTLALASALACLAGAAPAQSPIPESRVPALSSQDPHPGAPAGSPASSGSNVGSNIGAGATASPINNDPLPPARSAPETAEAPQPKPLFGLSREFASPPAPNR